MRVSNIYRGGGPWKYGTRLLKESPIYFDIPLFLISPPQKMGELAQNKVVVAKFSRIREGISLYWTKI